MGRIVKMSTKLDGYKTYLLALVALALVVVAHTTGEDATKWLSLFSDASLPAMVMALRHGFSGAK